MKSAFREFLFEYDHDGETWGISIMARDEEDAKARMKRMPFSRLQGGVAASVKFPGWISRLFGVGA